MIITVLCYVKIKLEMTYIEKQWNRSTVEWKNAFWVNRPQVMFTYLT